MDPVRVVGVVNITADSFSDGGRFLDAAAAKAHARHLIEDGADVIELGAASTHPDAAPVTVEEEVRRLEPVVAWGRSEGLSLMVDTFQPEVQRWAIDAGVGALNDVRGFPNPDLWPALASAGCELVVMHSVATGGVAEVVDTNADEIVDRVTTFLTRRVDDLVGAGVSPERVIVDPGMGFFLGSDPECSLAVLRALPEVRARLDQPLLVSVSRKSFLRRLTNCSIDESGAPTLAAELWAAAHGADLIRTHDVGALRRALRVIERLGAGASPR